MREVLEKAVKSQKDIFAMVEQDIAENRDSYDSNFDKLKESFSNRAN